MKKRQTKKKQRKYPAIEKLKKMFNVEHLTVYDPVYRVTVYFVVTDDGYLAKKHLMSLPGMPDDLGDESFDKPIGAKSIWNSKTYKTYAVWLRSRKDQNHLVHELTHIVKYILQPRGIYLTESDEAYAYYMEFLFHAFNSSAFDHKGPMTVPF